MKLRLLYLLLIILISYPVLSKSVVKQSTEQGLLVRQIPNTESTTKAFLHVLPDSIDTIFATIFRPAHCPRCEALIDPSMTMIKGMSHNAKTLLISVYPDSILANKYNKLHNLSADYYIYDTDESFSKFLSFNCGYLHIPYILKFSRNQGELIVGVDENQATPSFLEDFIQYKEPLDKHNYAETIEDTTTIASDTISSKLAIRQRINLTGLPKNLHLSEIIHLPVYHNGELFFNDKLAMNIYHFHQQNNTLEFSNIVEPDSLERIAYVDIPQKLYNRILQKDQVKFIPLQPFMLDNKHIGVAYSLPHLWMEDSMSYAYMNQACFISRNLDGKSEKELHKLNLNHDSPFFYAHFHMKAIEDKIAVEAERITWPMVDNLDEFAKNPEMDPFMDEFYTDYDQPTLATYNISNGNIDQHFGQLPSFAQKTKTGYSFAKCVVDHCGKDVVYANIFSGEICVADSAYLNCQDCMRRYEAFDFDQSQFKAPDTTKYYSYQCEFDTRPLFKKNIADIRMDSQNIYVLVRLVQDVFERPYMEQHQYVVISRINGQRSTYSFPDYAKNLKGYGIGYSDENGYFPFTLVYTNHGWELQQLNVK
jgi:hypothetical protein